LPETDIETARRKVQALRELVASTVMPISLRSQDVQVTISAGVASFPQDAAELFASADERMFAAKRDGRNRVVAGQEVAVAAV
jgi:diguanylate cyclase (GGDEF)-like protein